MCSPPRALRISGLVMCRAGSGEETPLLANIRRNARTVIVSGGVAAVTAAVMAGAPAMARIAAPSATTSPVIISGFKDGPVSVSNGFQNVVARLRLPRGSWAIFGKAWLDDVGSAVDMDCRLVAGGDFDQARASISQGVGAPVDETIALNVVHRFGSPGTVKLECKSAGVPVNVNFIKITAIKAGQLANRPLG